MKNPLFLHDLHLSLLFDQPLSLTETKERNILHFRKINCHLTLIFTEKKERKTVHFEMNKFPVHIGASTLHCSCTTRRCLNFALFMYNPTVPQLCIVHVQPDGASAFSETGYFLKAEVQKFKISRLMQW